jgi:hypothetical protein
MALAASRRRRVSLDLIGGGGGDRKRPIIWRGGKSGKESLTRGKFGREKYLLG